MPDPAAVARAVLDRNRYLTPATVDHDGRPWSSPVWFASGHHRAAVDDGLSPWTMADVTGDAELRLYRAQTTEVSVLGTMPGGPDERVPVGLPVAR